MMARDYRRIKPIMAVVGRMLEAIGVVLAPLALVVGVKSDSGRVELALLAGAALLFWVGRRLTRGQEG
jgi:hypothetical protein